MVRDLGAGPTGRPARAQQRARRGRLGRSVVLYLVAGWGRLQAAQLLKLEHIECRFIQGGALEAELVEISENHPFPSVDASVPTDVPTDSCRR